MSFSRANAASLPGLSASTQLEVRSRADRIAELVLVQARGALAELRLDVRGQLRVDELAEGLGEIGGTTGERRELRPRPRVEHFKAIRARLRASRRAPGRKDFSACPASWIRAGSASAAHAASPGSAWRLGARRRAPSAALGERTTSALARATGSRRRSKRSIAHNAQWPPHRSALAGASSTRRTSLGRARRRLDVLARRLPSSARWRSSTVAALARARPAQQQARQRGRAMSSADVESRRRR